MADLVVSVAGRQYRLACRDGEEEALRLAARHLDARAQQLQDSLGAITEPRLLLMAGLMIAGEFLEGRRGDGPTPAADALPDPRRLEGLVARVEALADRLEAIAGQAPALEEPLRSA